MNTTSLIGKVLLIFFSGTVIFVGFLYYLGATAPLEPVEEVLVDGQWVRYRDYNTDFPGNIQLNDVGPFVNPLSITGEAESAWFYEGIANAQVLAQDGSVLWEGFAMTDDRATYDMIVPFVVEMNVGDYTGEATLVLYQGDESDQEGPEINYPYSYTASLIITDGN